ncbi:hypothetical protein BDF19DRAFT_432145 [Syncephalis fuscata]|nr:hypothetical protein BDF19DRAFT_432145 [Syncephalis fuscata]
MGSQKPLITFKCTSSESLEACQIARDFLYSTVASSIMSSLVCLISIALIVYRRHHGLFTGLYRRVDNYWIPTSIDSFIIYTSISEFIQVVASTLLLLEWSKHFIISTIINTIWLVTTCNAMAMFTVGIISYIPSTFTEYTHICDKAPRILDFLKSKPAEKSQVIISVPSTKILFWSSLLFSLQMIVGNIAIGIWHEWTAENGSSDNEFIIEKIGSVWITIFILVIMVINGYYCHKFYRLLQSHVYKQKSNAEDQKNAARCYRNIFLALVVMFLLFICCHVVISLMNNWLYKRKTLYSAVVSSYYSTIHPVFGLIILYNIWQTTRLKVKRNASLILNSELPKVPLTIEDTPACYSKNSELIMESATNHYNAVMDHTLIWQTFVAAESPTKQSLNNDTVMDSGLMINSDIHHDSLITYRHNNY